MSRELLLTLAEFMGVIAATMIISLSPAFKRRPLIFMHPRREGYVALGLSGLLGVILWIYYSGAASGGPTEPLAAETSATFAFTLNDLLRSLAVSALALAPFAAALWIRKQPLLSAGLGKQTWRASLQLGLALALLSIFLRGKINAVIYGLSSPEMLYLPAMLGAAFAQEVIFRGYVQLRMQSWLGEVWGWLAGALLFALCQVPALLFAQGLPINGLPLALAESLAFGLVLGWIMRKSGNILAPALYAAIHAWLMIV